MNPSPILTLAGRVHSVTTREVAAAEARPEVRDESGAIVSRAYPAREGYDVIDVTVLTTEGGFATVSILPAALSDLGGEIPSASDEVEYAVRAFVSWQRYGQRSQARVGYSVAGDVTAARRAKSEGSRRSLSTAQAV